MIKRTEYVGIKEIIIIGIIIILSFLFSIKPNTATIANIDNIGLPTNAIEVLRKLLGY